jgi:hypothetical protein
MELSAQFDRQIGILCLKNLDTHILEKVDQIVTEERIICAPPRSRSVLTEEEVNAVLNLQGQIKQVRSRFLPQECYSWPSRSSSSWFIPAARVSSL